jgi:septal ring factor EnvC (AmiA/AmiB activator)
MTQDPFWFHKKWGLNESPSIFNVIEKLEERIKKLEEENVETTNTLYEIMNNIEAVDARIDILTGELWIDKNV